MLTAPGGAEGTALFLDTMYLLALINPNDAWRAKALTWAGRVSEPLVTTEAVLTEVADALGRALCREYAVAAIRDLRSDATVTCVSGSADLFKRGFDLYAERPDKDWSLTDCLPFVVMRDRQITRALSGDVHFVQAGFQALLREWHQGEPTGRRGEYRRVPNEPPRCEAARQGEPLLVNRRTCPACCSGIRCVVLPAPGEVELPESLDPVAQLGRPLEVEPPGGLLHLRL